MTHSNRKILIVDDEPKVMRFIEISLKLRGFEVVTLASGKQALDQFDALKPDLLLLDIIMPGINGFEILQKLRSYSNIPVIAYSASELNRQKALVSGADNFVRKPFYPDDIIDKINELTNHRD